MECLNVRYAGFLVLGWLALTCCLKQLSVFGACRLACCIAHMVLHSCLRRTLHLCLMPMVLFGWQQSIPVAMLKKDQACVLIDGCLCVSHKE
jgi:hypothetical protein